MKDRVYTVVEKAGYEGEQDITSFANRREAYAFIKGHYEADEVEELHVMVRTDFENGESEYQC
jgi:hypothetical protein